MADALNTYTDTLDKLATWAQLRTESITDLYKRATEEVRQAWRNGKIGSDEANLRIAEAYTAYRRSINGIYEELKKRETEAKAKYERTLFAR